MLFCLVIVWSNFLLDMAFSNLCIFINRKWLRLSADKSSPFQPATSALPSLSSSPLGTALRLAETIESSSSDNRHRTGASFRSKRPFWNIANQPIRCGDLSYWAPQNLPFNQLLPVLVYRIYEEQLKMIRPRTRVLSSAELSRPLPNAKLVITTLSNGFGHQILNILGHQHIIYIVGLKQYNSARVHYAQ